MEQVIKFASKKAAQAVCGKLTETSKMPCKSFNLPAIGACPTGAKLAKVKGSVCSKCYADKRGNYRWDVVQNAMAFRFELAKTAIVENREQWIAGMVKLIGSDSYFRWHDSGDFFSREYVDMVMEVCRKTPNTMHWIPTRELKLVSGIEIPDNVVIRMSAMKIDGRPPKFANTSTVHSKHGEPIGFVCKAPSQGNVCGDCRACWDKSVKNVSYKQH